MLDPLEDFEVSRHAIDCQLEETRDRMEWLFNAASFGAEGVGRTLDEALILVRGIENLVADLHDMVKIEAEAIPEIRGVVHDSTGFLGEDIE